MDEEERIVERALARAKDDFHRAEQGSEEEWAAHREWLILANAYVLGALLHDAERGDTGS